MRLLLDTCTFIWLSIDPQQIPHNTYATILDGDSEVLLSPAVAWEIAIKTNRHGTSALQIAGTPEQFVAEAISAYRLTVLPIAMNHALKVASFEQHHRDPFDRMLIAQALVEDIPIAAPDPAFAPYGVKLLWS